MWKVLGIVILVIVGLAFLTSIIEAVGGGGMVILVLLIAAGIGLVVKSQE